MVARAVLGRLLGRHDGHLVALGRVRLGEVEEHANGVRVIGVDDVGVVHAEARLGPAGPAGVGAASPS